MKERPMVSIGPLVLAALTWMTVDAVPSAAQVLFGPQLSYAGADAVDPGFGIGARVQFPILGDFDTEEQTTVAGALSAVITLDRFFPDCDPVSCSHWEANANGVVPLFAIDAFVPYIGAGVRLARLSADEVEGVEDLSDNDYGLNLLVGVRHDMSRLFGELRGSFAGDNDPIVLTFGVSFGG